LIISHLNESFENFEMKKGKLKRMVQHSNPKDYDSSGKPISHNFIKKQTCLKHAQPSTCQTSRGSGRKIPKKMPFFGDFFLGSFLGVPTHFKCEIHHQDDQL